MIAEVIRGLTHDRSWSETEIAASLMKAEKKAKHCKCNRLSCLVCGITMFNRRVKRIQSNPSIKAGYLTGGNEEPK